MKGIAASAGVALGDVVALNLAYELSALCTSIVASTEDGTLLHGRNLDFGDGSQFTETLQNLTIHVEFQLDGQVVFESATYAGYVGILTGKGNKYKNNLPRDETRYVQRYH
jgi:N-acylethanolamine-hydrolysing acid amidase